MGTSQDELGPSIFEIIVGEAYKLAQPRSTLQLTELAWYMNSFYDISFTPEIILRLDEMHQQSRSRPLIRQVPGSQPVQYERYATVGSGSF